MVIAGELGIVTESLRSWNKQHAVDSGEREGLTTPEREELRNLRAAAQVEQERELLKRAAAFLARETEIR